MGPGAFTPGAAAELAGEPWQLNRRAGAAEHLAELALPTTSEEDWRYSRIDELDLGRFGPVSEQHARAAAGALRLNLTADFVQSLGPLAGRVRTVDGVVVERDLASRRLGASSATPPTGAAPELLGELVAPHADVFVALSDAFATDVVVIDLEDGAAPQGPILLAHEQLVTETAEGLSPAVFPRSLLRLGAGARATVVEVLASGPGRRLVVPVTEVELGPGARLELYTVQQLGAETWHIGYQASRLARDAELVSFNAALGGDYARQLTRCSLQGEAAHSGLYSVYLGDGEQMQDLRTFQEHVAARTKSRLVFKGAVADKARSVYTGLIAMRKGARRADASQTNRNLVLSEGAHADSVPNLDIEENDVRCSHASAVGPIDPELIFYLESRGVPPEAARRLILLGFFEDLLADLPLQAVADHVRQSVAGRLAAVEVGR
jgi:Fe-S cluster assembly protein SufD